MLKKIIFSKSILSMNQVQALAQAQGLPEEKMLELFDCIKTMGQLDKAEFVVMCMKEQASNPMMKVVHSEMKKLSTKAEEVNKKKRKEREDDKMAEDYGLETGNNKKKGKGTEAGGGKAKSKTEDDELDFTQYYTEVYEKAHGVILNLKQQGVEQINLVPMDLSMQERCVDSVENICRRINDSISNSRVMENIHLRQMACLGRDLFFLQKQYYQERDRGGLARWSDYLQHKRSLGVPLPADRTVARQMDFYKLVLQFPILLHIDISWMKVAMNAKKFREYVVKDTGTWNFWTRKTVENTQTRFCVQAMNPDGSYSSQLIMPAVTNRPSVLADVRFSEALETMNKQTETVRQAMMEAEKMEREINERASKPPVADPSVLQAIAQSVAHDPFQLTPEQLEEFRRMGAQDDSASLVDELSKIDFSQYENNDDDDEF